MKRKLYYTVREFCEKNKLFSKGDKVLIGLSGGADSVYLTLVLQELAVLWDLDLSLIHVNHGIRGEEADRDEAFCRRFADKCGLPLVVFDGDVPELARREKMSLEEAARKYRYLCITEVLEREKIDKVAVAHHCDDQAETVLFHLARGSGLRGIGGMKAVQGRIVRPLLELRHEDILAQLEENGLEWCEDSTNESVEYSRNKIRHQVMPVLEEGVNAAAVRHLSQVAKQLQTVQDFLQDELSKRLEELVIDEGASEQVCGDVRTRVYVDKFLELPAALQLELVRWMIVRTAGRSRDIGCRHIEGVAALAEGESGKRFDLPYGLWAGRDYNTLWVGTRTEGEQPGTDNFVLCQAMDGDDSKRVCLDTMDGGSMEISFHREKFLEKYENNDRKIPKNNCTKWFDYARINGMLEFRHPASGDFLWLDAEESRRKPLNRLLIDLHVPRDCRKRLWVLAQGSNIVWIPELGRGSGSYYVSEKTQELLCAELKIVDGSSLHQLSGSVRNK